MSNKYVTFDSFLYAATKLTKQIEPAITVRRVLSGAADTTWGPGTPTGFEVALQADVTPGEGYGDPGDLDTTLAKREVLSFIDLMGATYDVVVLGPITRRSVSPVEDDPANAVEYSFGLAVV